MTSFEPLEPKLLLSSDHVPLLSLKPVVRVPA
ncbi:MAG: LEPR-XLL domain-containing protein [Muribaculaceae bacterium]|nr:LEPR-XLL domain-containing protein [Muribaculaceae bacterium]